MEDESKTTKKHFIWTVIILGVIVLIGVFSLIGRFSENKTPTGAVVKDSVENVKIVEDTNNKEVEASKCLDECSTDTCSGFDYISCSKKSDGCKDIINVGKVKNKCGIECLSNTDCEINEKCENYKCNLGNYKIGDKFVVNKVSYIIKEVDTEDILGSEYFDKQPLGIFYIISLTVENVDTQAIDYFSPDIKIIDSKGREFSEDTSASFYLDSSGYESLGYQLQPSLPMTGAIVFDLPTDAKGLKLKVSGGSLSVLLSSEEAFVDLGI